MYASLIVPLVAAALAVAVLVAVGMYGFRRLRSHRRWQRAWEDLVRSQAELDRELDEVNRRITER